MSFTREELRPLAILEGLPDEHLDWFCAHGERIELEAGDRMFERGRPADALWIVVEGVIQGFEEHGGQWLLVATTRRGDVTGMLPFSRMTHYPRHTVAAEPSVVLRLDASLLMELIAVSNEIGRRLVGMMSDRVRGDVRLEQQHEKMVALGRLSAGLAHELNNPAAAVRSATARLAEHREALPTLVLALVRQSVSDLGLEKLERMRRRAVSGSAGGDTTQELLEREDELSDWLEGHGVAEPWEVAATLAEVGISAEDLADLSLDLPAGALVDVLAWLHVGIDSDRIAAEINAAAGRISELISAIKIYSHMDRSPAHKPTDVREGLENTLTMLAHKLRTKSIRVVREFQEDLPTIPANPGELNQVWTNLIDNAIDAMDEGGTLTIKTKLNDMWVEAEICDDGGGIPADIRSQIFEPFFTTKEVGIGTGLGLGIANRIVGTHQGSIEVRSEPGETVMCVRLPVVRSNVHESAGVRTEPSHSG